MTTTETACQDRRRMSGPHMALLILFGAVGLGRSIRSIPPAEAGYPTRLEGQPDPPFRLDQGATEFRSA